MTTTVTISDNPRVLGPGVTDDELLAYARRLELELTVEFDLELDDDISVRIGPVESTVVEGSPAVATRVREIESGEWCGILLRACDGL